MKIVIAIIGVIILFIMFPIVMTSLHSLQTDEYEQIEAGVTTAGGEDSADVVLDKELWDDDIASVVTVSSNISGDSSASADSYVTVSRTLTVDGLEASQTRTLTLTYEYDALTSHTGMSEFTNLTPLLILLAILGIVFLGVWQGAKGQFS